MRKTWIYIIATVAAVPLFAVGFFAVRDAMGRGVDSEARGSKTSFSGSGGLHTETRDLSAFSRIEISGVGSLSVVQGRERSVTLTMDAALLDRYESEVRGNVLSLGFKSGFSISGISKLEIVVTCPELEGLSLSGAVNAEVGPGFSGDSLILKTSGTGRLRSIADYDNLKVDISGVGSTEITGEADELKLELSGTGSFDGSSLRTEEASVRISGAGRATLWVRERLEARVSGAGSVRYRGDPRVDSDISGVGRIERIGS